MLPHSFIVLGTFTSLIAGGGYLIQTLRGKVRPNRVSFFMWSLAPTIGAFAQFKEGAGLIAIQTLSVGVMPMLIFAASFANKKAEWKLTKFDLLCGVLSLLGLILWRITNIGNIAIAFSIFADFLASVPTMSKAYRFPETEIFWTWFITAIGSLISLLTVKHLIFSQYGFVTYLVLSNLLIAALIKFRPPSKTHEPNANEIVHI